MNFMRIIAQKMKFFIKDFFIFCVVNGVISFSALSKSENNGHQNRFTAFLADVE